MFIDAKSTAATTTIAMTRPPPTRGTAWADYLRLHRRGVTETARIVRAAAVAARQVTELRKVTAEFFARMDEVAGRI